MNALADIHEVIIPSQHLWLAVTDHMCREQVSELIANMALHGPLYVLAGSEWLPAYGVARSLRRKTPQLKSILNDVRMARAFTCYQFFDLLANALPDREPMLILNLLHTFYNPDVPLSVRFRLLRQSCVQLQKLSLYKPIVILIEESPAVEYGQFLPLLTSIADETLQFESIRETESQPGLF